MVGLLSGLEPRGNGRTMLRLFARVNNHCWRAAGAQGIFGADKLARLLLGRRTPGRLF
jgi:hypothetical protein